VAVADPLQLQVRRPETAIDGTLSELLDHIHRTQIHSQQGVPEAENEAGRVGERLGVNSVQAATRGGNGWSAASELIVERRELARHKQEIARRPTHGVRLLRVLLPRAGARVGA
jgi:hypothetical protein